MTCDERNSFGSLCKLGGLAGPCLAHTDQDLAFKGGSLDHTMDAMDDVRI